MGPAAFRRWGSPALECAIFSEESTRTSEADGTRVAVRGPKPTKGFGSAGAVGSEKTTGPKPLGIAGLFEKPPSSRYGSIVVRTCALGFAPRSGVSSCRRDP